MRAICRAATDRLKRLESLGIGWLMNPEQDKLKRELPFFAAALETCTKYVTDEGLERVEGKADKELHRKRNPPTKEERTRLQWERYRARHLRINANPDQPHDPVTGKFIKRSEAS
jgi:hypothetical protein